MPYASLSLLLLVASSIDGDPMALYQPLDFHYTGGRYQDEVFHYRLLDPRTGESEKKYPLLVWLHGRGEAGDDNVSHMTYLNTLVTPAPWTPGRFPFFLLALQCPKENELWYQGPAPADDDMVAVLTAVILDVVEAYPIDRDRIYLTGVSSGGAGCWRLASQRPDLFAAVAPLSGAGFDPTPAQVDALSQMPIWVFNCAEDPGSPLKLVRRLVTDVAAGAANIYLSEIAGASHDTWTPAFNEYKLLDWLLAQRRGDSTAPPPGAISWSQSMSIVFYHSPACQLLRGWNWLQLCAFGYLATVAVVIGRWVWRKPRFLGKVRFRLWRWER